MQTASTRIWTLVTKFIFFFSNYYTTSAYTIDNMISVQLPTKSNLTWSHCIVGSHTGIETYVQVLLKMLGFISVPHFGVSRVLTNKFRLAKQVLPVGRPPRTKLILFSCTAIRISLKPDSIVHMKLNMLYYFWEMYLTIKMDWIVCFYLGGGWIVTTVDSCWRNYHYYYNIYCFCNYFLLTRLVQISFIV